MHRLAFLIATWFTGLEPGVFSLPLQEPEAGTGVPWWVWLLVVLVLGAFLVMVWWWYTHRSEEQAVAAPSAPSASRSMVAPPPADDLEVIEGIGPKIASVLRDAGITTFAQLAAADPARLEEILQAAGLRLADPTSWPEQARLAAAGDWEAFKALTDRLKGGR